MKINLLLLLTVFFLSCNKNTIDAQIPDKQPVTSIAEPKSYVVDTSKIIWHDEFDYEGKPDASKWSYDLGGNGWGNNEKQFYTDRIENSFVENGNLHIKAIQELYQGNTFTSARLVTKAKGDFTYARVEVKAKLPTGVGTWPAIWALASQSTYGENFWPDNGEIDIMEHVGFDQNVIHGNIHTKAFNHTIGTNKGNNVTVATASTEFHVYAMNWLPDKIEIEVDGKIYFTFPKYAAYTWQEWPFDKPFHLLLNIAVGGNWGGQKGIDETIFPQEMLIDYVRIYSIKEK